MWGESCRGLLRMNKKILLFLYDIFDIEPTQSFIKPFINNDNLDLDKVLDSEELKCNTVYTWLYHLIYGIYPSKKDFNDWYKNSKLLNMEFLQEFINSQLSLSLGLIKRFDIKVLINKYENFIIEMDKKIMLKILIEKWSHRYQTEKKLVNKDNIIEVYKKITKNVIYPKLLNNNSYNAISGYTNPEIIFTDSDLLYMNEWEKIQYIHSRDHHWSTLNINACVIICNKDKFPETLMNYLIDVTAEKTGGNVVIYNYPSYPTSYNIDKRLFSLIPHVYNTCILIDDKKYPEIANLSYNDDKSFYYLWSKKICENLRNNNIYCRYIISDPTQFSLRADKCMIVGGEYNMFPNKINIAPKTILLLSDKIREIIDNITDEHDYKIFIDYYNEINPESYMYNGIIPIINEKNKNSFVLNKVTGIYFENIEDISNILLKMLENGSYFSKLSKNCKITRFILSEICYKDYWSMYLTNNKKNNIWIYYNFLILFFIKNIYQYTSIKYDGKTDNCVIIIDSRKSCLTNLSIINTMINLSSNWKCMIFTSKSNIRWYNDMLGDIGDVIHLPLLDYKFNIDIYNKILKSESFWNMIDYNKCLIIQDDGTLYRKGIEKYLKYDYVGAPWIDTIENLYIKNNINKELVGNGGFSLRNVSMMKKICKEFVDKKKTLFFNNLLELPEDCFFSKYVLLKGGKIANNEEASYFSSEEIYNKHCIGIHKIWQYNSKFDIIEFFNGILSDA